MGKAVCVNKRFCERNICRRSENDTWILNKIPKLNPDIAVIRRNACHNDKTDNSVLKLPREGKLTDCTYKQQPQSYKKTHAQDIHFIVSPFVSFTFLAIIVVISYERTFYCHDKLRDIQHFQCRQFVILGSTFVLLDDFSNCNLRGCTVLFYSIFHCFWEIVHFHLLHFTTFIVNLSKVTFIAFIVSILFHFNFRCSYYNCESQII